MDLSSQASSPCHDVHRFTISGRLRIIVNRPIRFRDGADLTDVTVTSSVSSSNECQSLLDRTNSVETNDVCSQCRGSSNRKRGRLCTTCGLFLHLACVRLGKT